MNERERFLSKAKRCCTDTWVIGYYAHYQDVDCKMCDTILDEFDVEHDIFTETLLACTGLKDKNGALMFEGDELDINGEARQIMYINGGYGYTYYGWINLYSKAHLGIVDIEVIGNIHDKERGKE